MRREAIVRGLRDIWPPLMLLAGAGAFGVVTQKLPAGVASVLAGVVFVAALRHQTNRTPSTDWKRKRAWPN
jgi:hypothetical protein